MQETSGYFPWELVNDKKWSGGKKEEGRKEPRNKEREIWEKSLRENILLKPSENLAIYTRNLKILAIPLSARMAA